MHFSDVKNSSSGNEIFCVEMHPNIFPPSQISIFKKTIIYQWLLHDFAKDEKRNVQGLVVCDINWKIGMKSGM